MPVNEARPQVIAAVDLGSNSFHLLVARNEDGRLIVIDRLKEMVQLAGGLGPTGVLDADTASCGVACLERFGQRLRDIDASGVRAVGTNTFRRIRDGGRYLEQARDALGHPIQIISGIEEARLIYSGVANSMSFDDERRLVIDIGGGSTEVILGSALTAGQLESLYIGCVGLSLRHFADGKITRKRFDQARLDVRVEFEGVAAMFRDRFSETIGASGTIRAAQAALATLDLNPHRISRRELEKLIDYMIDVGHSKDLGFPQLDPRRLSVMAGGIAVLAESMQMLGIKNLTVADSALRDGLLYDLIGRMGDNDARENTVRNLEKRIAAYQLQARRVDNTATDLLEQVRDDWKLHNDLFGKILSWAARLHEIGLDIAHAQYQEHGAYFLEHADMPGFPRDEQLLLSRLVLAHRRRLEEPVADLPGPMQKKALRLIVILRLAALLNRSRSDEELPAIVAKAQGKTVQLSFPGAWLDDQPLTREDLRRETRYLEAIDYRLEVDGS